LSIIHLATATFLRRRRYNSELPELVREKAFRPPPDGHNGRSRAVRYQKPRLLPSFLLAKLNLPQERPSQFVREPPKFGGVGGWRDGRPESVDNRMIHRLFLPAVGAIALALVIPAPAEAAMSAGGGGGQGFGLGGGSGGGHGSLGLGIGGGAGYGR
jgi:hypothetical protein